MSNYWNGKGVPENGQKLKAGKFSEIDGDKVFIGVNVAGDWILESGAGSISRWLPKHCKPLKSPEEVALEKAVADMVSSSLAVGS